MHRVAHVGSLLATRPLGYEASGRRSKAQGRLRLASASTAICPMIELFSPTKMTTPLKREEMRPSNEPLR